MLHTFYAVFDSKMASFSTPFTHQRDAGAIRDFSDWVNDGSNPNNMLFKHPEDYSLFRIGSFDIISGELKQDGPPQNLVTASAVKAVVSRPASMLNGMEVPPNAQ